MSYRVDLISVQQKPDFTVDERDGRLLIKPVKIKHTWTKDELCLRSLLTDKDGVVLSAGFPKFMNWGENAAEDAITSNLLATSRRILFTEKLDGSLIIRSVIGGKTHLRTRGNFDLGEAFQAVLNLAAAQYPDVLDPTVGRSDSSYLFEYTGPDNQIVLSYAKPELTFLGRVDHSNLRFYDEGTFSTPRVTTVALSTTTGKEAQQAIYSRERTEGVVAWLQREDGSIHLCKFKSAWYLRAHALKSFATPDRIRDYAWANGFETSQAFVDGLMRDGVDYESAVDKVPIFEDFVKQRDERVLRLDCARRVADPIKGLPDRKAKANALQADPRLSPYFSQLIYYVIGDEGKANEARECYGLGLSRAQFQLLKASKADAAKITLGLESTLYEDG